MWTFAAGTAYTVPEEVIATQLVEGDPALVELGFSCSSAAPGELPGRHCYLRNCVCHASSALRNATISPIPDDAYRVPDFVGNNYFCDAGAGPTDAILTIGNLVNAKLQNPASLPIAPTTTSSGSRG